MIHFLKRNDKPNNQGLYAVRLRITKDRRRKYISLKIFADSEYWDAASERFYIERNVRSEERRKENDLRKRYNYLLDQIFVEAQEIIDNFKLEKIDWTLNQFEDAFLNKEKQGKIRGYIVNHIENLRETGHHGNAECYQQTLSLLEQYDRKLEQRLFSDIDIKFVNGFDIYLQKRGCQGNTRKYYIKALRAIWNKAIQDKETTEKAYPFGRGGFQVAKLEEETAKRYLTTEYLNKVKTTVSENRNNEFARRLFLFSYYCFGISYIDMAYLSKANIKKYENGEYIVYKRQKIKHQKSVKPINIKINDEIQEQLDWFSQNAPTVDKFLLPIVTKNGYEGEQLHRHIRWRYHKYRDYLSELGKELGITDIKLTSYVSRHTMAMVLQNNDTPREVISQVLGHRDMKTTNAYLDSFDTSTIDEAVKVL